MFSAFDIFKISIGASSSHTVGSMRAALSFARALAARGLLSEVAEVRVELYGGLGASGRGQASDIGVSLGLMGEVPASLRPETVAARLETLRQRRRLALLGLHEIDWAPARHIACRGDCVLPGYPDALRLSARDAAWQVLLEADYYSIGAGFIVEGGNSAAPGAAPRAAPRSRRSNAGLVPAH